MGVERMPGPVGAWILSGLPDFRPGVTSLILAQTDEPAPVAKPAASGTQASLNEVETPEEVAEANALGFAAGKEIELDFWSKKDPREGPPSVRAKVKVYRTAREAAEAALVPLCKQYKTEEWGGIIYKVAGKDLYLAAPGVTDGDQAKVTLATMGFGKGKWSRGDLPGLKTVATYHTHVRGDVDLGGGSISHHYEGIVAPQQIGYINQLRSKLGMKDADRDKLFDDAFNNTDIGGDVGVAMSSRVDMYMMTCREGGFYHLDWKTLKETTLKGPDRPKAKSVRVAPPR